MGIYDITRMYNENAANVVKVTDLRMSYLEGGRLQQFSGSMTDGSSFTFVLSAGKGDYDVINAISAQEGRK